jgi:hypothetical protein
VVCSSTQLIRRIAVVRSGRVDDQLGQHRVVEPADRAAVLDPGVDADAVADRGGEPGDRAGLRQAGDRVLGVEADLDRVPVRSHVVLREGQRLTRRDPQLQLDEVEPGDELRDGVLDLQPGVHLQEVEGRLLVIEGVAGDEELDRAGTFVADGRGGAHRGLAHPCAQPLVDGGGRALLDDLLVPALDRALALEQVDDVAVLVAEDLDLHVPGSADQPFEDDPVVTERSRGLPPGGGERVGERGQVGDRAHPLAAAARDGLDEQREPDVARGGEQCPVVEVRVVDPWHDRDAFRGESLLGGRLVAHQPDHLRCRADEGEPRGRDGRGERGVLRQEPVTRVDRVGAGRERGGHDALDVEVGRARRRGPEPHGLVGIADVGFVAIRVAVHRHGRDAEPPAGPGDPARDLPPVGDQHPLEHRRSSVRCRR